MNPGLSDRWEAICEDKQWRIHLQQSGGTGGITDLGFKEISPLWASCTGILYITSLGCSKHSRTYFVMWSVVIYFLSVATFLLNLSGLLLFQLLIFYILSNYFSGICDREWWQAFVCIEQKLERREKNATVLYPFVQITKKADEGYFVFHMLPRTDPQRCNSWLQSLFIDIKQSHFHQVEKTRYLFRHSDTQQA